MQMQYSIIRIWPGFATNIWAAVLIFPSPLLFLHFLVKLSWTRLQLRYLIRIVCFHTHTESSVVFFFHTVLTFFISPLLCALYRCSFWFGGCTPLFILIIKSSIKPVDYACRSEITQNSPAGRAHLPSFSVSVSAQAECVFCLIVCMCARIAACSSSLPWAG